MSNLLEVVKLMATYFMRLLEIRFLKPMDSFAIVYLRKGNVLLIPLPRRRLLVLILNPKLSGEAIAKDLIDVLRKFQAFRNSVVDDNTFITCNNCTDENESDVYNHLANYLVENGLAKKAMVVRGCSIVYCYPEVIKIPQDVVESIMSMHANLYGSKYRYISLRISVKDLIDIVVVPLDKATVLFLEVSNDIPTKYLIRMIHLRYY